MIPLQSNPCSMAALQSKRSIHCLSCGPSMSWQRKGAQPGPFAFGETSDRRVQLMKAALTAEAAERAQQYNKSMSS